MPPADPDRRAQHPSACEKEARAAEAVDRELLQAALARGRRSALALAFGWLTIAVVAWQAGMHGPALGMLAFTVLAAGWRLLLWPADGPLAPGRVPALRRSFVANMAFAGLGWAFALLAVFPSGGLAVQLLIGLMFCGALTLGAQYMVLVRWALVLHSAPQTLAAMAVLWQLQASGPLLAAMAVFVAMLVGSARQQLAMNVQNIRHRLALAEANEALRVARDQADAASAAKSRFLAAMSHEIRTPMNGLLGALQVVEDTTLDTRQKEWLEIAAGSGDALLRVVNQVLDYSRIEAGEPAAPSLDTLALQPFAQDTVNLFRAAAEAKRLVLAADLAPGLPPRIHADAQRLRQVLANLLGNAIKFTESGSVRLRVAPGPLGLRFSVRDTGCGIALDAQPRLFEPFFQVDQGDRRRHGGTGLGLAICRQLATAMGGRIGVESVAGRGSAFHLDLPLSAAEAPPAPVLPAVAAAPAARAQLAGRRCLLVEDNPVNRLLALEMLNALGLAVSEAADGMEALRLAERERFDLILMDCQMPRLDGYAATAAIRASERRRDVPPVPIIALTASALAADAERCLAAGMDDHLAKPYRRAELEARLLRWLGERPAAVQAAA